MNQVLAEAENNTYLVFITGPCRTTDIELTTTLGVHGPLESHPGALSLGVVDKTMPMIG
jgi:L-lactate utilization protein LutC